MSRIRGAPKTKVCTRCSERKDIDVFFAKDSQQKDGIAVYCKLCKNEIMSAYRADPEKMESLRLGQEERILRAAELYPCLWQQMLHSISPRILKKISNWRFIGIAEQDLLYVAENLYSQKNCEICELKEGVYPDHDHVTGRFRGWLCSGCNGGLGKLGDNIEGLEKALTYLYKQENPININSIQKVV